MFFEQPLTSFAQLARMVRSLDQDAGIRVVGKYGGKGVLVFVTRFGEKYTMMTYTKSGTGRPGRRLSTAEFDAPEDVGAALRELGGGRLRAWLY